MARDTANEVLHSEDSSEPMAIETEGSEGSDSLFENTAALQESTLEYQEDVLGYLDLINSGVVCSVVLLGTILGAIVIRVFLDKVSE